MSYFIQIGSLDWVVEITKVRFPLDRRYTVGYHKTTSSNSENFKTDIREKLDSCLLPIIILCKK